MRTIPTRVGKTVGSVCYSNSSADHPHAGGENNEANEGASLRAGPSPRGWGKRTLKGTDEAAARTIPTRVGKTDEPVTSTLLPPDHPHAGGENALRRRQPG